MEKLAYVEPTMSKVVLTTNERIAAGCGEGSTPSFPDGYPGNLTDVDYVGPTDGAFGLSLS